MCCRNFCSCQCGCGCNSGRCCGCGCNSGNLGSDNVGSGNVGGGVGSGLRPTCGWAYLCQFPNTSPIPLFQDINTFAEETSGCGCG